MWSDLKGKRKKVTKFERGSLDTSSGRTPKCWVQLLSIHHFLEADTSQPWSSTQHSCWSLWPFPATRVSAIFHKTNISPSTSRTGIHKSRSCNLKGSNVSKSKIFTPLVITPSQSIRLVSLFLGNQNFYHKSFSLIIFPNKPYFFSGI